jgi:hypothetical protein
MKGFYSAQMMNGVVLSDKCFQLQRGTNLGRAFEKDDDEEK